MADKVADKFKVKELEVETSHGKGTMREEDGKIVITLPLPAGKSIQDVANIAGHSCHERCAGLVSNAAAFVF